MTSYELDQHQLDDELHTLAGGTNVLLIAYDWEKYAFIDGFIRDALGIKEGVVYVTDYPSMLNITDKRFGMIELFRVPPMERTDVKIASVVNLSKISVYIRDILKKLLRNQLRETKEPRVDLIIDNITSLFHHDSYLKNAVIRFIRVHMHVVKTLNAIGLYIVDGKLPDKTLDDVIDVFRDEVVIRII
jgi:hypothetical protein